MRPIEHILVVVDPMAGERQPVVDKAMILARCSHASVELLVCDVTGGSLISRGAGEPSPVIRPDELLERLAAPLRTQGLETTVRIVRGESLHGSILEYLRSSNVTLVMKHTHHHSFARRTFLKNTDWHLAHASTVPLLLTKDRVWSSAPNIMAAIDPDSEKVGVAALDRKILKWATALSAGLSGNLHLIHAFIPASLAAAISTGPQPETAEMARHLECESSFIQSRIESFARVSGVGPTDLHVEMGTPTERLLQSVVKYDIDVVVIGASSHGPWHRIFIGSTAARALEFLPCDLLVVGPDADSQGRA